MLQLITCDSNNTRLHAYCVIWINMATLYEGFLLTQIFLRKKRGFHEVFLRVDRFNLTLIFHMDSVGHLQRKEIFEEWAQNQIYDSVLHRLTTEYGVI